MTSFRLGNLAPVRDLNFVADTVEGFIKAAESPLSIGELINIGSGTAITMGELVNKIVEMLGGGKEIVVEDERHRPEASEVMKLICDNRRAKELLGWEPQVSLEEGLGQTIDFIREHLPRYKPQVYNL